MFEEICNLLQQQQPYSHYFQKTTPYQSYHVQLLSKHLFADCCQQNQYI